MSMRNANDTIGNRIRDLPACSAVPAPPRTPKIWCNKMLASQEVPVSRSLVEVCVHSRLGLIILLPVTELEVILMHSMTIPIIVMKRRWTAQWSEHHNSYTFIAVEGGYAVWRRSMLANVGRVQHSAALTTFPADWQVNRWMIWAQVGDDPCCRLSAQVVAFEITFKTMSWGGGLRIVGILCSSTVGAVERCLLILLDISLTHSAVQRKNTATGRS